MIQIGIGHNRFQAAPDSVPSCNQGGCFGNQANGHADSAIPCTLRQFGVMVGQHGDSGLKNVHRQCVGRTGFESGNQVCR